MTAEPFLRMDGVSKRYPGVVVLHEASLEAYRGEAVALMGANGAGKSTLMSVGSLLPSLARSSAVRRRMISGASKPPRNGNSSA